MVFVWLCSNNVVNSALVCIQFEYTLNVTDETNNSFLHDKVPPNFNQIIVNKCLIMAIQNRKPQRSERWRTPG